ncbi:MAG: hypothetical protein ACXAAH_12480 [Promethearchaeota archaeon]|jgi:hypothetical protein
MRKIKEYLKRIAEALERIADAHEKIENQSQPGGPGNPPPGGG